MEVRVGRGDFSRSRERRGGRRGDRGCSSGVLLRRRKRDCVFWVKEVREAEVGAGEGWGRDLGGEGVVVIDVEVVAIGGGMWCAGSGDRERE